MKRYLGSTAQFYLGRGISEHEARRSLRLLGAKEIVRDGDILRAQLPEYEEAHPTNPAGRLAIDSRRRL
jgi:hypothetical protein